MGWNPIKKIKKAIKKVANGIKKGIKKVVKGVKKVVKKIGSSKILKALAIAAAVVVTGGAALGAMGATAASGGFTGWMVGASQAVTGGTLFGTSTALARFGSTAAQLAASPFQALGTGIGTVGAKLGINLGAPASQQAALAVQPTLTTTAPLTEAQILAGQTPASIAKGSLLPSANTASAQLAASTQQAFQAGSAIGTSTGVVSPTLTTAAGSFTLPTSLATTGATSMGGTAAQQLASTVPAGLGIEPSVVEKATQSWAARNPKTAAFLSTVGTGVATSVATGYAMQQLAGDPELQGSMAGLRTEGATDFDPLRIYAAERGIADTDISKYFTFSNTPEGGNMPLFSQETIGVV
jgi:hypothetical protein